MGTAARMSRGRREQQGRPGGFMEIVSGPHRLCIQTAPSLSSACQAPRKTGSCLEKLFAFFLPLPFITGPQAWPLEA